MNKERTAIETGVDVSMDRVVKRKRKESILGKRKVELDRVGLFGEVENQGE